MDILVPDFTRGIYFERIPVKTVSDRPVSTFAAEENSKERMRKRVVRLGKLSPDQMAQLQSFMCFCAG